MTLGKESGPQLPYFPLPLGGNTSGVDVSSIALHCVRYQILLDMIQSGDGVRVIDGMVRAVLWKISRQTLGTSEKPILLRLGF